MPRLEQYAAFVETIERGSLTAAARHLDRSTQSVSRALATLEQELGVQLVRRTTRRLQPSPAGSIFYQRLKTALREIENARAEASRENTRIGGLFRVGAPLLFGRKYVTPVAVAFLRRFPELEIEFVLTNAVTDLIEERLDVSIRIGELNPSSLKARRLALLRRVLVASTSYLSRHGNPRTPSDLAKHLCVIRTFRPEGDTWALTVDGVPTRTPVRGVLRCNDAASAKEGVIH